MQAQTNAWQSVESGGCLSIAAMLLLLVWAPVAVYHAVFWDAERFAFAFGFAAIGLALLGRQRFRKRTVELRDMTVTVDPTDLRPSQDFVVSLKLSGATAHKIRWWRVELTALVADAGAKHPDQEVFAQQEFVVDPEASEGPVNELQMLMRAPSARELGRWIIRGWFVRATVESDHGRMESGRVEVRIAAGPALETKA